MNRIQPDMGLPAHSDTVIYLLQILRLVEAGERPDSIRLEEWDAHKATLMKCRTFPHLHPIFVEPQILHRHKSDVQFWDEFIQKLKDGDMVHTDRIEQARKYHLQDIDLCKYKLEVFY